MCGHLSYFIFFAIVSIAAMNISCTFPQHTSKRVSFGYILRTRIAVQIYKIMPNRFFKEVVLSYIPLTRYKKSCYLSPQGSYTGYPLCQKCSSPRHCTIHSLTPFKSFSNVTFSMRYTLTYSI